MSATNENILKSLAVLEQNLKDINSAKEQVNNVVKSSGEIAKSIESYKSSFESLSVNVKAVLEDSRKFNLDSITKLAEQTNNIKEEVAKLTEFNFQDVFSKIEKEVVDQFKKDLKEQLITLDNKGLELQSRIDDFKVQIGRIEKVDLDAHFNEIEAKLTNQTDKLHIEISRKYEEVKSLNDNIIKRLGQQDKETKSLKTLLFVTIGVIIIGIVINFVMK